MSTSCFTVLRLVNKLEVPQFAVCDLIIHVHKGEKNGPQICDRSYKSHTFLTRRRLHLQSTYLIAELSDDRYATHPPHSPFGRLQLAGQRDSKDAGTE